MISFTYYQYMPFILGAALIVLGIYGVYIWRKRKILETLSRGGGLKEMIHGSKSISRIKSLLLVLSVVIAALLLLGPRWGERIREVQKEGSDVLVALDVSNSMLARDIKPNRLERARGAVRWIAESLKGDRIGLILFAGDAFLQCPLTSDKGAFMMFLDSAGPDSINLQGTDIGRVMDEACKVFQKKRLTSRMLILITDGEDHQGAAERAIGKFRDLDVSVYTLGVGREKGEIIPVGEESKSADLYFKDEEGKLIRTRKNPDLLKKLAGSTGGAYIDISNSFSGMKFILEIISDQQKSKFGSSIVKEKKEQYPFFAVLLALVLSAELMLYERRGRRRGR
jgi:Ca-activated chloride channel homolog